MDGVAGDGNKRESADGGGERQEMKGGWPQLNWNWARASGGGRRRRARKEEGRAESMNNSRAKLASLQ